MFENDTLKKIIDQIRDTKIVYKNPEQLLPYCRNGKIHSDFEINEMASQIKEFGFTTIVLIDNDDVIIAGHKRTMAAIKAGLSEIPCKILNYLTKTQIKAYRIADNQSSKRGTYDLELLGLEISELNDDEFDLSLIGLDDLTFGIPEIEDKDNEIKEKLKLTVECENHDEMDDLFRELNDRGFKVKV